MENKLGPENKNPPNGGLFNEGISLPISYMTFPMTPHNAL
nr:MAG TPA: hypothetical protein [Caudoviricetes sp.]